MKQPLVAVSTDTRHFEKYTWHPTPDQYLEAAIFPLPACCRCSSPPSASGSILRPPVARRRRDADRLQDECDPPVTVRKPSRETALTTTGATRPPCPGFARPSSAACRCWPSVGGSRTERGAGRVAGDRDPGDRGRMDHRAAPSEDQDERFAIHQERCAIVSRAAAWPGLRRHGEIVGQFAAPAGAKSARFAPAA